MDERLGPTSPRGLEAIGGPGGTLAGGLVRLGRGLVLVIDRQRRFEFGEQLFRIAEPLFEGLAARGERRFDLVAIRFEFTELTADGVDLAFAIVEVGGGRALSPFAAEIIDQQRHRAEDHAQHPLGRVVVLADESFDPEQVEGAIQDESAAEDEGDPQHRQPVHRQHLVGGEVDRFLFQVAVVPFELFEVFAELDPLAERRDQLVLFADRLLQIGRADPFECAADFVFELVRFLFVFGGGVSRLFQQEQLFLDPFGRFGEGGEAAS